MDFRAAEISVRLSQSNFFVQICTDWIDRARAAENDPVVRLLGPYHPTEIAEIQERLFGIANLAGDIERLVAVEELGDMVEAMLHQRRLPDRISSTDGVDEFQHMGEFGNRQTCVNHPQRYGAFTEGDHHICAHCLVEAL